MTLGGRRCVALMVTATYRDDVEWQPWHMPEFLDRLRQWSRRRGVDLRYQWVAELTKRGRMHYHLLLWGPKGFRVPLADERGWWPHGMTRTERARRPVGYMVKYTSKAETPQHDHHYPRGARIYGLGGGGVGERLASHRASLPAWLALQLQRGTRVRRIVAAGWLEVETGALYRSPYGVRWSGDPAGGGVVFECYLRE